MWEIAKAPRETELRPHTPNYLRLGMYVCMSVCLYVCMYVYMRNKGLGFTVSGLGLNVDPWLLDPFPLIGIIIAILLLRPLKGGGL